MAKTILRVTIPGYKWKMKVALLALRSVAFLSRIGMFPSPALAWLGDMAAKWVVRRATLSDYPR